MKNVILCAINATYSHSSLSLLCLKYASKYNTETMEFSINDSLPSIIRAIALKRPVAVGFSCYIWNIDMVLRAASSIKRILPRCFILLGGPEVSYDCKQLMHSNPFIDMIISGPGEIPFSYFTQRFQTGEDVTDTPSAHIRCGDNIITTQPSPEYDMNETPFMYGDLEQFKNKIVYYETSRGCPFCCAYCMSAGTGVSFLPTERVKTELEYFIKSRLRQVKLVDRTFNYPRSRAKEILGALISISERYPDSPTNFHFEITASLLDAETLSLLKTARKGLIRLEAGIQSTNAETLRAIQRGSDTDKPLDNLRALCRMDNIHVHADLIAGLPLESYSSFASSFNDAYSLKPSALQLGFLKLLKGSPLRCEAEKYGIVCTEYAPYEVLRTGAISYEELSKLHLIENALNLLYNSGHCLKTLEYILPCFNSSFAFFEAFALYLDGSGYFSRPQTMKSLFEHIYTFASAHGCLSDALAEALAFDWLCLEKPRTWPAYLSVFAETNRAELRVFLGRPDNIKSYLPAYERLSPAEISKRIFVCTLGSLFPGKTLLFDYGRRRSDDGFCQFTQYKGFP